MPRADELPDSLTALVRRQALELSPARFDFDTSRLLKVLDRTLAEVRATDQDAAPMPAPAEAAPNLSPTALREHVERSATPGLPQAAAATPAGRPLRNQLDRRTNGADASRHGRGYWQGPESGSC